MARILFAWELGGGFGHAGPMRALADRLAAAGHQPVFALRDVVVPAPLLRDRPYPVLQAPFWPKPFDLPGRSHAIASHADLIALAGYGRADDLAAMVAAWDALIDLVRPDLIVADNAPTLALATYRRVPTVFVGYGFTLPPAHEDRFPLLRRDTPPLMSESFILGNVEKVQRRRGAAVPPTLPALYRGAFRALACARELDPYLVRKDPELGPMERMPRPAPPPAEPTLFAYLGGELRRIEPLIQAFALMRSPVQVFLRDDAAVHASFLAARGVTMHRQAPALVDVIPTVSCVLSLGGHTTSHAALMGGRSQLVIPVHLETEMTVGRLIDMGVGNRLVSNEEPPALAEELDTLVRASEPIEAAMAVAHRIAERDLTHALDLTAEACIAILQ
jgi:UDP:flavonoid glycosyltransferase YjiC (YdhE family)